MARNYDEDWAAKKEDGSDLYNWDDYYKLLASEGLNDDNIRKNLRNTAWDKEGSNAYNFIHSNDGYKTGHQTSIPAGYKTPYSTKPNNTPYKGMNMSLWDAWKNGKLGRSQIDEGLEEGSDEYNRQAKEVEDTKNNRNYLAIDAIAKGLRGIGKDISNVGAAYTGGAIQDSTPEKSLWESRNNELMKQGISSEAKNVGGSDAAFNAADKDVSIRSKERGVESQDLENNLSRLKQLPAQRWKELMDNAPEGPVGAIQRALGTVMLDNSVNGREVNLPTILAAVGASELTELEEAAKAEGKSLQEFVTDYVAKFSENIGPTLNINANLGPNLGEDGTPTNSSNPYEVKKTGWFNKFFGQGNQVNPEATLENMKSSGFLKGTPYEYITMGDAMKTAKKERGFKGSRTDFVRWLWDEYKDKSPLIVGDGNTIEAPAR